MKLPRFLSRIAGGSGTRKSGLTDGQLELFREIYGDLRTLTGERVDYRTALQVSAVLACARVIGTALAATPVRIMRKTDRRREAETNHPLYDLLDVAPSELQTAYEFFEQLGIHLALCQRAYVYCGRIAGKTRELIVLEPNRVHVERADDGTLTYRYTPENGQAVKLTSADVWHVRGMSWNGYEGLDAIRLAREAIGLSMATEAQHSNLHANGASMSGVYSIDAELDATQHRQLLKTIRDYTTGSKRGSPLILDRGAKWLQTQMTGVDAQHLETRRYQVEDVCRHMGVLPIMVGHADKTQAYASIEQMLLAHVVHTVAPLHCRLEKSINHALLTREERSAGLYAKFFTQALLRGAMKDQADYFAKLVQVGVMVRNEARELLDLNPLPGLDEPLLPANLGTGMQDRAGEPADDAEDGAEGGRTPPNPPPDGNDDDKGE